jgi:hypothetical protein
VRLWRLPDVRLQALLTSTGEYRELAGSLSEALAFLWQLRLDSLTVEPAPHPPRLLSSKEGYYFVYDKKHAGLPTPPCPDETRFDQVLRWAEQQSGTRLKLPGQPDTSKTDADRCSRQ